MSVNIRTVFSNNITNTLIPCRYQEKISSPLKPYLPFGRFLPHRVRCVMDFMEQIFGLHAGSVFRQKPRLAIGIWVKFLVE
jgi:hypothetical protein